MAGPRMPVPAFRGAADPDALMRVLDDPMMLARHNLASPIVQADPSVYEQAGVPPPAPPSEPPELLRSPDYAPPPPTATLYPHEQPNLDVMRDAMHRATMAGIVGSTLGQRTPNWYGVKRGIVPFEVNKDATAAGVRDAMIPAELEKMRSGHVNEMRDLLNRVAESRVAGTRADQQTAASLASSAGMYAAQRELLRQRGSQELEHQEITNQGKVDAAEAGAGKRMALQDHQADLRDRNNKRQHDRKVGDKAIAEGGMKPIDARTLQLHAISTRAKQTVHDMIDLIDQNPEVLGPKGASFTVGQARLSAGPLAQKFHQLNALLTEDALQDLQRQSVKGGGTVQREVQPYMMDNAEVSKDGMMRMYKYFDAVQNGLQGAHPDFDFERGAPKPGFSRTPFKDAATKGAQPQGKIRVRRKADGKSGTVDAADFDAGKYEKI